MAALPTVPLGVEDENKQEYLTALKQVMDSLQARQQPNLFSVAGALLDPGRTGNVGEAIGRAASEAGKQQDIQAQQLPAIATMRAQIAAQKYEMGNQSKALQLMSGVLGVPTEQVMPQLQSGNVDPSNMAKLAQVYPMIAQLSPKVGEIVKSTFTMQNELRKAATEDLKAGMGQAELVAKYGPAVLSLIPGGARPTGAPPAAGPMPTPQPAPQPVQQPVQQGPRPTVTPAVPQPTPAPTPAVSQTPTPSPYETAKLQEVVQQLQQQLQAADPKDTGRVTAINAALQEAQQRLVQLGIQPTPARQAPVQPLSAAPLTGEQAPVADDTSRLPLAVQAEVQKKRVEETDKSFFAQRAEIFANKPDVLEQSNAELRQFDSLAAKNPQVFGLMMKQGLIPGLQTLAQRGINMQFGTYSANVGADVNAFLQKTKLTPEQQQTVRDMSRILANQFLTNAKTNRGLLGVNPTDNDARLLQAPMASMDDTARSAQLWAREQLLMNKQRGDLYDSLTAHDSRMGSAAAPASFFGGNDYKRIVKQYGQLRAQLYRQFYPE